MVDAFGSRPEDIRAGIGPSIGPCCYSVGAEVLSTFRARLTKPVLAGSNGAAHLDLWRTNERQLRDVGVRSIETAGICTACHAATYYSHRGEDGVTGRFAMVAGIPAD
jgi:copper oxidase (laccase) domain-containing protein